MTPPRRRVRATGTLAVLAALLALSAPASVAVTRDVEITKGSATDGQLAILPSVALLRDVGAHDDVPVALVNGGDEPVTVGLRIVTTEADAGRVRPSARPVTWARLPRDEVTIPAGGRADFSVAIAPPPGEVPAAISLVATTVGTVQLEAVAHLVLWPAGTEPKVTLALRAGVVEVASDTPAIVDLRLRSAAAPLLSSATDMGPLVLLAGAPRSIAVDPPRWLLGSRIEVVAAIEGVEIARAAAGQVVSLPRLLVAIVVLSTLAFLVATALRQRRAAAKPTDAP